MKKLIFTSLFLLAALPAHAAITIGALTQLCGFDETGKEFAPSAHASCQSYIAGIVDYQELFKTVGKTSASIDFCLPEMLTYTDIQRTVLTYLQSHANFSNSPAASAVAIALHNEYACDGGMPLVEGVATDPSIQQGISMDANGDIQAPDMNDFSGDTTAQ